MTAHDPRLTRISWAIMAAGAVGIVGASMGWNTNIAAPTLLLATAVLNIYWGIVTICYLRFMNPARPGRLGLPRVIHIFHGGFIATNLAFIIASAVALLIDRDKESRWLYLALASVVLCEILMLVWTRILVRSTDVGRPKRSEAEL